MDHGAGPGGGAGGEDDDRVTVLVHRARQGGPAEAGVQGGGAAGQPRADRGHRAQPGQVRQGEAGPAGERPGPAGHGLGGRVRQDDVGPGQGEPGAQDLRSRAGVEDRGAQPEAVHGEQNGQGARTRSYRDTDRAAALDAPGVQGRGVAVGEVGEVPAGGLGADRTGTGGAEHGGTAGVGAEGVGEGVEHQRGSSPWWPGPLSRYQRAVPTIP